MTKGIPVFRKRIGAGFSEHFVPDPEATNLKILTPAKPKSDGLEEKKQ